MIRHRRCDVLGAVYLDGHSSEWRTAVCVWEVSNFCRVHLVESFSS